MWMNLRRMVIFQISTFQRSIFALFYWTVVIKCNEERIEISEIYVLSKEEGGRHSPFFSNYRPQFYFRTTDVTGVIKLPEGVEMVMPGDKVSIEVELIAPIAMEKTQRFAIREGGRTVASGRVTEILK